MRRNNNVHFPDALIKVMQSNFFVWGVILLMAVFWRFVDYQDRWVLNQDQGRDASIALFANRNWQLPMIGSPSSAGPFNFGPWYFWLIMVWERLLPIAPGPWIGFTGMSVASVLLYAKIGQDLAKKTGLLVMGLEAAVSVGQVKNAPDMLNTVIVGFSTALALWAALKFIRQKKTVWVLLLGLTVGWSINFHFQALGLLSLPLVVVFFQKGSVKTRLKTGVMVLIGLLITFLPLIWFEVHHSNVWVKSVTEYYTVGVKKFYVPVRWLTELRDFWPKLFGTVTVGIPNFGYLLVFAGLVAAGWVIKKKEQLDPYWLIIGSSFLMQIFLMRFYGGVRSEEYLIVFHGFIILITCGILLWLWKFKNILGISLLLVMVALASYSDFLQIKHHPSQAATMMILKNQLATVTGGKEIRVFNYRDSNMLTFPMFYLFYQQNLVSNAGEAIGFCDANRYGCPTDPVLERSKYRIYKLQQTTGFKAITPDDMYKILSVNYGYQK